ncbi:MAG: hypothetical protein Q7S10_01690 [bacterium]|nr:hypothetical protein [bacterium]
MKLTRIMELTGEFASLMKLAKNRDKITLFEGYYDSYQPSPGGVIIRQDNRFLLNGERLIYEGEADSWKASPHNSQEIFIAMGNQISINGKEIVLDEEIDAWFPDTKDPRKLITEKDGEFFCNGGELMCVSESDDWYPDPTNPKKVIIRLADKFLRNGRDLICECECAKWRPYLRGIVTEDPTEYKLYFNGSQLLYEIEDQDNFNSWSVHPYGGIIIANTEEIFLVVHR